MTGRPFMTGADRSTRHVRHRPIVSALALVACSLGPVVARTQAQTAGVQTAGAQTAGAQTGAQTTETSTRQPAFEVQPRGYVQFDWRGFPDTTVAPDSGRQTHDTVEVRRMRVGVDGRWGPVQYELSLDPQDLDDTLVRDAYGRWRITRGFRLQVGQFKLPGSREYDASARTLDFPERSALAQFAAPGRDLGAMAFGTVGRVEYSAGIFAGDGRGRGSRARQTAAGRIAWGLSGDLEAAVSGSLGRTRATDSDPANSLEGRSTSGYRFFERVYVDGRRTRTGADVAWSPGRWRLAAETLRVADARDGQGLDLEDLPSVVATGWSASLIRQLGRRQGAARSRWREVDLGVRVDRLAFDDSGPDTDRESVRPRATDIRPRAVSSALLTASWQPTRWSRLITHAGVDRFSDARSAPEGGRDGPYWTLGTRLQFELP